MVLVIFGATGDLSRRMLFPSLYHLYKSSNLPSELKIIAFGRRDFSHAEYTEFLLEEFVNEYDDIFEKESWNRFVLHIDYFIGDLNNIDDFALLGKKILYYESNAKQCLEKMFYLAVGSEHYNYTIKGINQTLLQTKCEHSEHVKVIVEKPFGESLESFDSLNKQLLELFEENQIFRIDHYLGKETVQNILFFRNSNPLFSKNWSRENISKIEVNVLESLGVGSRAPYYDKFGQTKDMVQSHLLQLLALVLMKIPHDMQNLADEKTNIISNLKVTDFSKVKRGQYDTGVVNGKKVSSYVDDLGHDSVTETFVEINTTLELPEWQGVEIVLRSGKRMSSKNTSVVVHFKGENNSDESESENKITFEIQPNESITLDLQVKKPGTKELETVPMVFEYQKNFRGLLPDAYEQLLLNVFNDNKSSFITTEELEASWRFIDPIVSYWRENNPELIKYPAGSSEV